MASIQKRTKTIFFDPLKGETKRQAFEKLRKQGAIKSNNPKDFTFRKTKFRRADPNEPRRVPTPGGVIHEFKPSTEPKKRSRLRIIKPFGSQVGFLTARDESGKEIGRSKPFSIEPDTRPRPAFDQIVTFGSVGLGDPTIARKKRKLSKKDKSKKKKKAKPKPLKSIFDLSF